MDNKTTKILANSLFNIQQLSDEDIDRLITLIIDFFAAMFAGYTLNDDFNRKVEKVVLSKNGDEESYVFGQGRKSPCGKAAFLNAVYGHGAELDDGNKKAAGHAGVHIIPSVFALADMLKSSNKDVLLALATGYEAYIRISSSVQPGLVERGFHSTGMAGTLACAAACARLYHLDEEGIESAIALSTTLTGGLLSYGDSRPAIKPLNPGKAAENGIFAARLANEGIKGPEAALEGPHGWFHAVSDKVDYDSLQGTDHLQLHDCYMKLYPSCRHTHCGIDAAIYMHDMVKTDDIETIRVYIYPKAIELAGIELPQNMDETKFSIKYTLACALTDGYYGISSMHPPKLTEKIIDIINKIILIPDPSMEVREKGIRGTRVEIVCSDGTVLKKDVLTPKGDPENPLSREQVIQKLKNCSESYIDQSVLNVLIDAILSIENDTLFNNPMKLLNRMLF